MLGLQQTFFAKSSVSFVSKLLAHQFWYSKIQESSRIYIIYNCPGLWTSNKILPMADSVTTVEASISSESFLKSAADLG